MKNRLSVFALALILIQIPSLSAQKGPSYDGNRTKAVIEKMIKAHGGLTAWKNSPSLSFEHIMSVPQSPTFKPWLSNETHHPISRQSYIEWGDGAKLGYDGKDVWSKDWKILNPAGMMSRVAFFFLNIPWITQDDIVNLKLIEDSVVDHIEKGKSFYTIHMTFDGASPYEYYDLYIDKASHMLKGVKYAFVDKDLMKIFKVPAEVKSMGPHLKVFKEYTEVDGLKFPSRYDTHDLTQGGLVFGVHNITKYSVSKTFPYSKAKRPQGAVIFKASKD